MQSDLGSEQHFMANARFTLLVHNEAMNAFTVCADKESNMGEWSRDAYYTKSIMLGTMGTSVFAHSKYFRYISHCRPSRFAMEMLAKHHEN